jgi:hypothetical protein
VAVASLALPAVMYAVEVADWLDICRDDPVRSWSSSRLLCNGYRQLMFRNIHGDAGGLIWWLAGRPCSSLVIQWRFRSPTPNTGTKGFRISRPTAAEYATALRLEALYRQIIVHVTVLTLWASLCLMTPDGNRFVQLQQWISRCLHHSWRKLSCRNVGSQVLRDSVFWDIIPSTLLEVNWPFGGTCRVHLQGWRTRQEISQHEVVSKQSSDCCLLHAGFSLSLHFSPEVFSENRWLSTSTWRYIPRDRTL